MRCSPTALIAGLLLFATIVAGDPPGSRDISLVSHLKREPVQSTAIASVGYSKRLHVLEIEFRNGATYRYLAVAPDIYRSLMAAPSKARFYDANIRGKCRSVHVKRRPQ